MASVSRQRVPFQVRRDGATSPVATRCSATAPVPMRLAQSRVRQHSVGHKRPRVQACGNAVTRHRQSDRCWTSARACSGEPIIEALDPAAASSTLPGIPMPSSHSNARTEIPPGSGPSNEALEDRYRQSRQRGRGDRAGRTQDHHVRRRWCETGRGIASPKHRLRPRTESNIRI